MCDKVIVYYVMVWKFDGGHSVTVPTLSRNSFRSGVFRLHALHRAVRGWQEPQGVEVRGLQGHLPGGRSEGGRGGRRGSRGGRGCCGVLWGAGEGVTSWVRGARGVNSMYIFIYSRGEELMWSVVQGIKCQGDHGSTHLPTHLHSHPPTPLQTLVSTQAHTNTRTCFHFFVCWQAVANKGEPYLFGLEDSEEVRQCLHQEDCQTLELGRCNRKGGAAYH